jgi:hypothetical protein
MATEMVGPGLDLVILKLRIGVKAQLTEAPAEGEDHALVKVLKVAEHFGLLLHVINSDEAGALVHEEQDILGTMAIQGVSATDNVTANTEEWWIGSMVRLALWGRETIHLKKTRTTRTKTQVILQYLSVGDVRRARDDYVVLQHGE